MPSTSGRSDFPPTKIIVVYRNGDGYFPGRKVVVNPRHVPYFDNFLTSLTKGIEAPFGAVRRLYTATQGHQVHHLDDLQHGSVYVAAGNEAFKKLKSVSCFRGVWSEFACIYWNLQVFSLA